MSTHSHACPVRSDVSLLPWQARAAGAVERIRRWRVLAPLTLASIALGLLAIVPIGVHRSVGASLDAISQVVEPAQAALTQIQVALGLESAGTRGFLLTGDQRFVTSHHRARARRVQACAALQRYENRIRPGMQTDLAVMNQAFRAADRVLDDLFSGRITREQYLAALPEQQARMAAVLDATMRMQRMVNAEDGRRREQVHAAQRLDIIATLIGLIFALPAIFSIARLSQRHLALAEHAEDARAAEERSRLDLARVCASRQRLIRGFSHDIQNPLNAADGYLFMLEEDQQEALTAKQKNYVEKARRSVDRAAQLIGDLLTLARAESGQLPVRLAPMDLGEVAARAVEDHRSRAGGKALAISVEVQPALPPIQSDSAKVSQILGNLIDNAIKYTPYGGITVRAAMRRDLAGAEHAVIDVSDTGLGIDREYQQAIFDEFQRLNSACGSSGAGIGLAISQGLARTLGGNITLESEPGQGSTFTLWLPLDADGCGAASSGQAVH